MSGTINRVLSPLDACVVRRSRLEALEAEVRELRRELAQARAQVEDVRAQNVEPGGAFFCVPLYLAAKALRDNGASFWLTRGTA